MDRPSRILIAHAEWIVTMDPERRILKGGAIAIENDRIAAIGATRDVASKFTAEKTIDASGKLVIPGLIDTHVHSTQQLGTAAWPMAATSRCICSNGSTATRARCCTRMPIGRRCAASSK
jgi:cytosine/adenosine deaminase-related metal-dependent hydrolase